MEAPGVDMVIVIECQRVDDARRQRWLELQRLFGTDVTRCKALIAQDVLHTLELFAVITVHRHEK